jgi:hypothetical protein
VRALAIIVCALVAAWTLAPTPAHAKQGGHHKGGGASASGSGSGSASGSATTGDAAKPRQGKPKTFDFTGIDISGQNRSPQLLYFLERANEELERASLEKRSFIPEMVRSIEEDNL